MSAKHHGTDALGVIRSLWRIIACNNALRLPPSGAVTLLTWVYDPQQDGPAVPRLTRLRGVENAE
jgi:hypothetical protein